METQNDRDAAPLVCRTCGGSLQFVRYHGQVLCLHVGKSQMNVVARPHNAARLIARAEGDAAFHRSVRHGLDVIVVSEATRRSMAILDAREAVLEMAETVAAVGEG